MNALISTAFEVIGLVAIAVAVGVGLWTVDPALAIGSAGVILLVEAQIIELFGPKPASPPEPTE